jgi:drug/metabolite transporter (DMT)-like permease
MLFLILAVASSSLIAVAMRATEGKRRSAMGMFVVNYLVCSVISCLFAGRIAFFSPLPGFGRAMVLGSITGALYLLNFVLYRLNIEKNGMAMASTFMKLGVVISTLIAVVVFREMPSLPQILGILLSAASILMIHTEKAEGGSSSGRWLLPLLLVLGGITDSMANVFDKTGDPAVRDYYLFYIFAAAFVISLIFLLVRKEGMGRWEVISGILIGIPNYFSSRFLLLSLGSLPAVIVYPAVSVGTIAAVSLAGFLLFREALSRRKLLAMAVIALSLILLNL